MREDFAHAKGSFPQTGIGKGKPPSPSLLLAIWVKEEGGPFSSQAAAGLAVSPAMLEKRGKQEEAAGWCDHQWYRLAII